MGGALLSPLGTLSLVWATFAILIVALVIVMVGRCNAFPPSLQESFTATNPRPAHLCWLTRKIAHRISPPCTETGVKI